MAFSDITLSDEAVQGRYAAMMSDVGTGVFKATDINEVRTAAARDLLKQALLSALAPVRGRYTSSDAMLSDLANVSLPANPESGAGEGPLYNEMQALFALAFISVWAWEKRPSDAHRLYSDARQARNDLFSRAGVLATEFRNIRKMNTQGSGGVTGTTSAVTTTTWI